MKREAIRRHRQRSLVEDYNLTAAEFSFVHAFAAYNYEDGKACYALADSKGLKYDDLPKSGIGGKAGICTRASKLLKKDEVRRYIDDRLDKSALRADITEDEVNYYLRRCVQIGLGDRPIRKTMLVTVKRVDQDGGDVELDSDLEKEYTDVEVFEPNLAAAHNAAVSLGKTKGMFTDKHEVDHGVDGLVELLSSLNETTKPPGERGKS